MGSLKQREQAAVEAVARRFSAAWDPIERSLALAGKRIEVAVESFERRGRAGSAAALRLRFDKVVTRLLDRLQSVLSGIVPNGTTVLLTVTAPVRSWSKTALALEAKIRAILGRGASGRVKRERIEGNQVHIQALKRVGARSPKLIGFVHNPESDALLLLDMAREGLTLHSARASKRPARRARDRWLVVISGGGTRVLDTYRSVCSQVGLDNHFKKLLVVLANGDVEELTD